MRKTTAAIVLAAMAVCLASCVLDIGEAPSGHYGPGGHAAPQAGDVVGHRAPGCGVYRTSSATLGGTPVRCEMTIADDPDRLFDWEPKLLELDVWKKSDDPGIGEIHIATLKGKIKAGDGYSYGWAEDPGRPDVRFQKLEIEMETTPGRDFGDLSAEGHAEHTGLYLLASSPEDWDAMADPSHNDFERSAGPGSEFEIHLAEDAAPEAKDLWETTWVCLSATGEADT